MTKTQQKRILALYWMRLGHKPSRRGLINRLRRVAYPRARKCGSSFPSIRPSRPDVPKFCF